MNRPIFVVESYVIPVVPVDVASAVSNINTVFELLYIVVEPALALLINIGFEFGAAAGPVAPVAPVGPVGPFAGPVGPTLPVGPVTP